MISKNGTYHNTRVIASNIQPAGDDDAQQYREAFPGETPFAESMRREILSVNILPL